MNYHPLTVVSCASSSTTLLWIDTLGAEAVDVISSEGTGGLRERKPGYLEPTSSFMSHINARRESKIMLNGQLIHVDAFLSLYIVVIVIIVWTITNTRDTRLLHAKCWVAHPFNLIQLLSESMQLQEGDDDGCVLYLQKNVCDAIWRCRRSGWYT